MSKNLSYCSIMLEKYKRERRWAEYKFDAHIILFFLTIFYLLSLLRYVEEVINETFWLFCSSSMFLLFLICCSIGELNSYTYNHGILLKIGKYVSMLATIYGTIVLGFMVSNHYSMYYEYFFFHILSIFSVLKWSFIFAKEETYGWNIATTNDFLHEIGHMMGLNHPGKRNKQSSTGKLREYEADRN